MGILESSLKFYTFFSATLLSVPNASKFFVSSCVVYSGRGYKQFLPKTILEESGVLEREKNYSSKEEYIKSKIKFVSTVARNASKIVKTDWFICESGTVGPEYYIPGVQNAFTAVAIIGPNDFEVIKVFEGFEDTRDKNMKVLTQAAL